MSIRSILCFIILIQFSNHSWGTNPRETCHTGSAAQLICATKKNGPDCPLPDKLCAGPLIPINASVICYSPGWGQMNCFAYPTSEDNIFTYEWSINGVNLGLLSPQEYLACSEGNQHITVTVQDIYGQTETVDTYGFCRDGYPD